MAELQRSPRPNAMSAGLDLQHTVEQLFNDIQSIASGMPQS